MAALSIVLGNKNYSSWSMRGWLILKHLGVPFDEEVIQLDQPDTREQILRYSPSAKVPVVFHGDLVIWESLAIGEYLAEQFPDAGLWPSETAARAYARAIAAEMHAGFTAMRQNMPMNLRASLPGKGMAPGVQDDINRITAIWRTCRERFANDGPYLFGSFTVADAMYTPVTSRFNTYGVDLDETSKAYCQSISEHSAYQEWLAAAKNEPWIMPREER